MIVRVIVGELYIHYNTCAYKSTVIKKKALENLGFLHTMSLDHARCAFEFAGTSLVARGSP